MFPRSLESWETTSSHTNMFKSTSDVEAMRPRSYFLLLQQQIAAQSWFQLMNADKRTSKQSNSWMLSCSVDWTEGQKKLLQQSVSAQTNSQKLLQRQIHLICISDQTSPVILIFLNLKLCTKKTKDEQRNDQLQHQIRPSATNKTNEFWWWTLQHCLCQKFKGFWIQFHSGIQNKPWFLLYICFLLDVWKIK